MTLLDGIVLFDLAAVLAATAWAIVRTVRDIEELTP